MIAYGLLTYENNERLGVRVRVASDKHAGMAVKRIRAIVSDRTARRPLQAIMLDVCCD